MITDRDLCMAVATKDLLASEILVGEVMTGVVYVCHPNDDVKTALRTMRNEKIMRLPVVNDEGRLQGVISMKDIMLNTQLGKSGLSYEEVITARNVIGGHSIQRNDAAETPAPQQRARLKQKGEAPSKR
jgi:signal-transduction protein with cAMP-binding, CBS, and nucleotidyltransferase domain